MYEITRHGSIGGRLVVAAVACAAVLLTAGCGKGKQTAVKPPPPKVQVADVVQDKIPITMAFSGTIKAVKDVDIIPRVSGYVIERHFTEGDYVQEGAPLYKIDPKPYQAKLEAAQAAIKKDQASFDLWKKEAVRYTKLARKGAGSVEDREKAIARREESKAAIARDQADIDKAELELGYCDISAPFTGRIQQTRINVGQLVAEQKDVLTSLVQIDPVYVVFNISRGQVYEVQQLRHEGLAMQTLSEYKATIELSDGSTYPKKGTLDYISSKVDPSTDTLTVRAAFPNPHVEGKDLTLIVGQYVPVTLYVGERDAILVPQKALVASQAGTHVFVLKDGKVEHRSVEVGPAYRHDWVIEKGLKQGEQVIVEGVQKVRPGMEVTVVQAKAKTDAKDAVKVDAKGTTKADVTDTVQDDSTDATQERSEGGDKTR